MIIDERKNLVTMITPMPAIGDMLHINWVHLMPNNGTIAGFIIAYNRADRNFENCLRQLRGMNDAALQQELSKGGWLGGSPSGKESSLLWAAPADYSNFKISKSTFGAPCRIEVWTVVEIEGRMHLFYKNSPSYSISLKLNCSIKPKEFEPAEYGFLHRLKKPAVSGVEIVLSTDSPDAAYVDGAVYYRLKSDKTRTAYPIARAAVGKPLRFISTEKFQYKSNDFEVAVTPEFADMYEL